MGERDAKEPLEEVAHQGVVVNHACGNGQGAAWGQRYHAFGKQQGRSRILEAELIIAGVWSGAN